MSEYIVIRSLVDRMYELARRSTLTEIRERQSEAIRKASMVGSGFGVSSTETIRKIRELASTTPFSITQSARIIEREYLALDMWESNAKLRESLVEEDEKPEVIKKEVKDIRFIRDD